MISSTQSPDASAVFAALNANSGAGKTKTAVEATQDRFLKLLVTQMKTQDPLNPMDNAQVTSQMAQLSTVTGIDKLNATLQALSSSMSGNQALQSASGMIGHGVLVQGDGVDLDANNIGLGGVDLAQSVEGLNISIYDQAGALVRNIALGPQQSGLTHWQWDGRDNAGNPVAPGSYKFKSDATQAGAAVSATSLQFGLVNSVTQSAQGVTMGVGALDGITMSQIVQIL
jgi:flagellar basal-body rod modification protein FlgD